MVAFAFGAPYSISANRRLAAIASAMATKNKAPIFTQRDIKIVGGIPTTYVRESSRSSLPTLPIARLAVRWARLSSYDELIVIAAKPHLWRAQRDIRQAIKEMHADIKVRVCRQMINQQSHESWFCPSSTQLRTRTWWAWWRREIILRLMPFWLYQHIAI